MTLGVMDFFFFFSLLASGEAVVKHLPARGGRHLLIPSTTDPFLCESRHRQTSAPGEGSCRRPTASAPEQVHSSAHPSVHSGRIKENSALEQLKKALNSRPAVDDVAAYIPKETKKRGRAGAGAPSIQPERTCVLSPFVLPETRSSTSMISCREQQLPNSRARQPAEAGRAFCSGGSSLCPSPTLLLANLQKKILSKSDLPCFSFQLTAGGSQVRGHLHSPHVPPMTSGRSHERQQ